MRGWVKVSRIDLSGMALVSRVDLAHGGARLRKAPRTSAGGVRVRAAIARTGILTYRTDDGRERRELLPASELARADSLATLADSPITIGHPAPDVSGSQLVSPERYRSLAVGHVSGTASVDRDHAMAELVVLDADAIARIDSGELVELSPGYVCWVDPTPGTFNGERYDAVQRERRYNHVALLPAGGARGGASVTLRLDSAGRIPTHTDGRTPPPALEAAWRRG